MDWNKLKELLQTPASATNPGRDHELAAMVPELVAMYAHHDPDAWDVATKMMRKEATAPTPAAAALLARLKALPSNKMHPIYVDELPAANELVKAGLAMFPKGERRYVPPGGNIRYLYVAIISEGSGWEYEGTLEPLTNEALNVIQVILNYGPPYGLFVRREAEMLRDAGIVVGVDSDRYTFTDAVKARHIRSTPALESNEAFVKRHYPNARLRDQSGNFDVMFGNGNCTLGYVATASEAWSRAAAMVRREAAPQPPKQYRMVVRADGAPRPFGDVTHGDAFMHKGVIYAKSFTWAWRGFVTVERDDSITADTVVQPVTITWEEQQ